MTIPKGAATTSWASYASCRQESSLECLEADRHTGLQHVTRFGYEKHVPSGAVLRRPKMKKNITKY
ncbi:hypothetical protein [Microcoleus sp. FACHB-68]|uniref:hypothetical protein n=1 Tax=Microcoleus sp. FACHB-68 TaxID=2692826 RepID=UPI0016877571|nr:hypothetical protein [Microcoleus sp. FACHB-68]MBD1935906.1 hypothetical protein [Microcoleus sp. FACHB-68]